MKATRQSKASERSKNSTVLYRSETNKVLGGVCGGLGEVFGIDPTVVRAIFALATLFGGSGLLFYIILWVIIPSESKLSRSSDENVRENIQEMKLRAETFTKEFGERGDSSKTIFGVLLLVFGGMLLLGNFGYAYLFNFQKLWPLLIVILGIYIISQKNQRP